jgi:hypothetical protein
MISATTYQFYFEAVSCSIVSIPSTPWVETSAGISGIAGF